MSDEVKRGKGRPSAYGKNNENTQKIVADILDPINATPYYVQKLIGMGYLKIAITEKGQEYLNRHQE